MNAVSSALILLVSIGLYGLIHSWLASLSVKRSAERLFGPLVSQRFYRLAYNVFAVISFLPILALAAALPDQLLYTIRSPWIYFSLFLQAAALLVLGLGVLQTGALRFLGLPQLFDPKKDQKGNFVTSGLYRWVRHPLYSAGFVFLWMAPQMSVNLLVLNLGLSLYLVIGAFVEERKLVVEFGEAYKTYSRDTPMFIPKPPKKLFRV